jgi:hypothetical protein
MTVVLHCLSYILQTTNNPIGRKPPHGRLKAVNIVQITPSIYLVTDRFSTR